MVATALPALKPQAGKQEAFLSTPADIAIYGGAAFGGKTWALCFEALRHVNNPDFTFVLFRRTTPQIRNPGGLWDETMRLYPLAGGAPRESILEWRFPSGAWGKCAHLQYEQDKHDWQGAQIPYIAFDQLEHFTAGQFFYMLSRNRSTSGIRPYIRGNCNPDPDSFVAGLIAWWIDPETGYAIEERAGVLRWFVRIDDQLDWGDSKEELAARHPQFNPATDFKSLTFIPSKAEDNPIGMQADPGYMGNLLAMAYVDRMRLKEGNWKVKAGAGMHFRKEWFQFVDQAPPATQRVRAWDLAATEPSDQAPDPDWTAGVKMAKDTAGKIYIEDIERLRGRPEQVEKTLKATANRDGKPVAIRLPQDPGQAGKAQGQYLTLALTGYTVHARPITGDKITRANPLSAQAEAGNVYLVRGSWNDAFLDEAENFGPTCRHDDQIDAAADAFHELTQVHSTGFGQVSF